MRKRRKVLLGGGFEFLDATARGSVLTHSYRPPPRPTPSASRTPSPAMRSLHLLVVALAVCFSSATAAGKCCEIVAAENSCACNPNSCKCTEEGNGCTCLDGALPSTDTATVPADHPAPPTPAPPSLASPITEAKPDAPAGPKLAQGHAAMMAGNKKQHADAIQRAAESGSEAEESEGGSETARLSVGGIY